MLIKTFVYSVYHLSSVNDAKPPSLFISRERKIVLAKLRGV
jgi:hypothetical protein